MSPTGEHDAERSDDPSRALTIVAAAARSAFMSALSGDPTARPHVRALLAALD